MIFPSNRVRIMVATKPVDFRKGHDGLGSLVKNELRKDPVYGNSLCLPFAQGRSFEADLLGWHRHGASL
ncbi:IS66 family insertion sequence element accessory protein TnpB [Paenochrobactrum pullorum]|uniref:IS66 family insertion sequence element accessory protein TnpB n=1 Tax=Paenochrobactrum pullorum TaxID=1324351 RepID=UPI0035BC07F1